MCHLKARYSEHHRAGLNREVVLQLRNKLCCDSKQVVSIERWSLNASTVDPR